MPTVDVAARAERHAALGDPVRLAIIDELTTSDRAPVELQTLFDLPSNLLTHHLDVLERVGLISRHRSSGDGRRRYVHLDVAALDELAAGRSFKPTAALFVCTHNSARSQLAAALWRELVGRPARSAGTHPAEKIHPGAIASARRSGLDIRGGRPQLLDSGKRLPPLVITVCDRAHEELPEHGEWLHWSIPDPVAVGTAKAFDAARDELRQRITSLIERVAA